MKKIKIVTDSNSGILQQEGADLDVCVVPMPFAINDEEYLEEISISQEQFYQLLENNAYVNTSQPSPAYIEELWEDILKEYEEILYIPMTSGLSGTCSTALRLAEQYNGRVVVVDNKRISVTQKESVFEAIELAKQGKSASEIKEYLENSGHLQSIYIALNVLKYLKKGGRISPAAATLGSLLNVKPILTSRGQNFEKYSMAFSFGQAKKKMIQKIKNELETEFKDLYEQGKMTVSVAHTNNYAEAEKFKQEIMKEFPNLTFRFVDPLSLSVSCHIGPGAIAVALCVKNY